MNDSKGTGRGGGCSSQGHEQTEVRTEEEEDRESLYRPGWKSQQGTKQASMLSTAHPGKGLVPGQWETLQSYTQRTNISTFVFFLILPLGACEE